MARVIEMRSGEGRRIDRVLSPGFSAGLANLALAELRQRRDEAAQEETDLSYLRRLLHARIDIVRAEQQRRISGDEGSVVDQLRHILADEALGTRDQYQPLTPSQTREPTRSGIEALVSDAGMSNVGAQSDDQLTASLRTFTGQEAEVSRLRRDVQRVMDALSAEIAARYADGSASVDELIARERGND